MLRLKYVNALLTIIALALASGLVLPAAAAPCAILKVSLPEGTYVGYNSDPWLCECWLLNLTGNSQTFTLRINNTSSSTRSYDTHLIIALNEAAYNNLVSLVINGTNVPKSVFHWGTPTPYNKWTWPSGDVYPTYFDDTKINVGYIPKLGYKNLIVSVVFSDVTGVRMHFDAYGKTVTYSPPSSSYITHNSLSYDSTVVFQAGPPPPQPPIASFSYDPLYPETNQVATFDASESYDPDGYIVSYAWDFGDGSPVVVESDPITTHTFTAYGDFTVKLTVTDNDGLTDEETHVLHISQHPVASFTVSPPDPLMHETVTFDASSSSPDGGDIISYKWDFGDGNVTTTSEPIITHVYMTFGTYLVTLNVTDSEGKWDIMSQLITVEAVPIADFWWAPTYPQRGEPVTFDASGSTGDGGYIVSYAWDFGDGSPIIVEADPIITYAYSATGNYTVTLNVTDSEGRSDTESKVITVVARRYFLEVKTDPPSIVPIPGSGWYDENTNVELTAPDIVSVSDTVQYRFSFWDVNGTTVPGNPITVFMNANYEATAHYVLQYKLTVRTSGLGTYTTNVYNGTTILGTATDASPYSGWFDEGSAISLDVDSPIVNGLKRFVFSQWSGDASGTSRPTPVVMNAAKDITANYITQYQISVTANPSGAQGGTFRVTYTQLGIIYANVQKTTPWTEWVDADTSVTVSEPQEIINLSPGTRYKFDYYDPSASVLMDQAKTITLMYKLQYAVTFTQIGSGAAPTVTYTADTDPTETVPFTVWVKAGSTITYTYQDIVQGAPGVRYVFTGVNPPSPQIVNAPLTVSGTYQTQYYLTVNTNPAEVLTLNPSAVSGQGWYNSGFTATVDAVQTVVKIADQSRYDFRSWTGATPTGVGNQATVLMDEPKTVTANYQLQYLLTVLTDPAGLSPQPTRNPLGQAGPANGWWYDATTTVTLTAQTVSGYNFNYWDVDGASKGSGVNPIQVLMDGPHTATAHYTQVVVYRLTITSTSGGTTDPAPGTYMYTAGSPVQVRAIANANYMFDHWELNDVNVGSANPYSFMINSNSTLKAVFKASGPPHMPVGGYSISLIDHMSMSQLAVYATLIAFFGAALSLTKRKRK